MFERGGKSYESGGERCPGETNCEKFALAKSETGNGLDACGGCDLLPTKYGNNRFRCPGLDCPDFRKVAGNTWLEKAEEACAACVRCKGNFPLYPDEPQNEIEDKTVEILIDEIADIIFWENTGSKTEKSAMFLLKPILIFGFRPRRKTCRVIQNG